MATPFLKSLVCLPAVIKDNEKIIKQALFEAKKPLTRRQINQITGIEIGTLCLPLLRMVEAGKLYIAHKRACPITGNSCYHYALQSWKGGSDGNDD
jgi:hypothetical protein